MITQAAVQCRLTQQCNFMVVEFDISLPQAKALNLMFNTLGLLVGTSHMDRDGFGKALECCIQGLADENVLLAGKMKRATIWLIDEIARDVRTMSQARTKRGRPA